MNGRRGGECICSDSLQVAEQRRGRSLRRHNVADSLWLSQDFFPRLCLSTCDMKESQQRQAWQLGDRQQGVSTVWGSENDDDVTLSGLRVERNRHLQTGETSNNAKIMSYTNRRLIFLFSNLELYVWDFKEVDILYVLCFRCLNGDNRLDRHELQLVNNNSFL